LSAIWRWLLSSGRTVRRSIVEAMPVPASAACGVLKTIALLVSSAG
jgi:hypothetical protein